MVHLDCYKATEGSAAADTTSLSSILIPMMVDKGYDADFSTAVTVTFSCEGLLVTYVHPISMLLPNLFSK